MMTALILVVYVFGVGLCVGSFLNVCIYRLPLDKSIADPPRSMCPACNHSIRFYDNIPVLSYLWLKGRCRHCQAPISLRYPMVEIMTGLIATAIVLKFGFNLKALVYFIFCATLVVVTFIDIDHRIIPNRITLPGIPIGLVASLALPDLPFIDALLGLLLGGGSLWLVAWSYHLATGREGMGGGDIKLLAMIGTIVGWQGVLFTIFVGSAVGMLVGMAEMLAKGKNMKFAVPFGPFLAIGALTYLFLGPPLIYWYLTWLR